MYKFNLKRILIPLIAMFLVGIGVFAVSISADAVEGDTGVASPTYQVNFEKDYSEGWIGEEININGTIIPSAMDISNAYKDIVLAIDVSKSMGDSAGIECTIKGIDYCTTCKGVCKAIGDCKWSKKKCVTHGVGWDGNGQPPVSAQCTIKRGEHPIEKNYCQIHNKDGKHDDGTTKLAMLKSAVIDFVDKNKSNEDINLSIVTYSKKASIKKQQNKESFNLKKDTETIKSIISNIQFDNEAGTNTGEVITKADFMLGKSKSLSKNLVLLTDGLPTYYSKNSDGQENTDINDIDPSDTTGFGGDGKNMTKETKGYAVKMGKNIKEKGYNTFTISYGISDSDGAVIEEIHKSMSAEKKNHLKADGKNIKEAFNTVSTSIKQGDIISPITLDLNLDNNYGLMVIQNGQVVSDGSVSIGPIKYTWIEGKGVYEATSVPLDFSLVGTKKLEQINIFEKSKLIIQVGEKFIECQLPEYKITINEQLPNIEAHYQGISPENPMVNEDIELSYEVVLNEFDGSGILDAKDSYPIDVRLQFDLGDNILSVEGLKPAEEGSREYYLTVPVVYNREGEGNIYKPSQDTVIVSFKVKSSRSGLMEFGTKNSMEYIGVGDVQISKKINTPAIHIENVDIMEHGLYGGAVQWYSNGTDSYVYNLIEESEGKSFAKGSTLTVGAKFRLGDVNSTLNLSIDNRLKVDGNPTIYVQDKYGKLIKVGEMSTDTYEYNFASNLTPNDEMKLDSRSIMVALYNITLPSDVTDEITYENNIYLKGSTGIIRGAKTTTIISGKDELPDLF